MKIKTIKTIASITCGLGMITTIPLSMTSCSKDQDKGDKGVLSMSYDHPSFAGSHIINGFAGDAYGVDIPLTSDHYSNLISLLWINVETGETEIPNISDVTFNIVDSSQKKISNIRVEPTSPDSTLGRICWNSESYKSSTNIYFSIIASFKNTTAKPIDFCLRLASPDTSIITSSIKNDQYANVSLSDAETTLRDVISVNQPAMHPDPDQIEWTITEVNGPNQSTSNQNVVCDWITIQHSHDNKFSIVINPGCNSLQISKYNSYLFAITAKEKDNPSSFSNSCEFSVGVDCPQNYLPYYCLNTNNDSDSLVHFTSLNYDAIESWPRLAVECNTLFINAKINVVNSDIFSPDKKLPGFINNLVFDNDPPNNGVKILPNAFADCVGLHNVYISKYVKGIGENAFAKTPLINITLDKNNENFEFSENLNCTAIVQKGKDFDGSNGVVGCLITGIPCINLALMCLPNNSFKDCYGITGVEFLNSIYKVGNNVFDNCINLKDIYWSGVASLDNFDDCLSHDSFANMPTGGMLHSGNRYLPHDIVLKYLCDNFDFPLDWNSEDY